MDYLDELQTRLENGISQEDIDKAIELIGKHRKLLDSFPCECHGDMGPDDVIKAIKEKGDHWEEYVISVICGVAVSEEIAKSYASTAKLSDRLEDLLDLTRDFVSAVVREDATPLLAEQLGAHFCVESALFKERLIKLEQEVEKLRKSRGIEVKTPGVIN